MSNEKLPYFGVDTKYRVLVAEDEDGLRELYQEFLEELQIDVISAKDGKAAVEYIMNEIQNIHLVLTDEILPQYSGIDIFDIARKKMPDIPFLFISGNPAPKLGSEPGLPKNVRHLKKPCDANSIIAAISMLLHSTYGKPPEGTA